MRIPMIVGNWKMCTTPREAGELAAEICRKLTILKGIEVVLAPPFTSLSAVAASLSGSDLSLAGQDLHWEDRGAFTGAVSHGMLDALGCKHVLVGHSERRRHFGETDHQVQLKIEAALRGGLHPILCVGESEEEREAGRLRQVLRQQISQALDAVPEGKAADLTVAYEPVWAIGTGRAATVEDAADAHQIIRRQLEKLFGTESSRPVRILYGGSVTPDNVAGFAARPEVDGVLVGGASLGADSFTAIVRGGWEARPPTG